MIFQCPGFVTPGACVEGAGGGASIRPCQQGGWFGSVLVRYRSVLSQEEFVAAISDDTPFDGQEPSAWQVLAPVIDLVTPMAFRAAAALRLADLMTDGPVPVDELARRSGSEPDALGRLLRHLVCRGRAEQPR